MTLLDRAYEATNRRADEEILISAVTSFQLRADVREHLMCLEGSDFFNPAYGRIWNAGRELTRESRIITIENLKTLLDEKDARVLEGVYASGGVRAVEVERGVTLVRDAAKRRRLVNAMKEALTRSLSDEGYDSTLNYVHEVLSGLDAAETSPEAIDMSEAIEQFWEDWEAPPQEVEKFETPWPRFNDFVNGGLKRRTLTVIGAESGRGKSVWMLNAAGHCALTGGKVAIFSPEMEYRDLTNRIVAASADVRIKDVESRTCDEHTLERLQNVSDLLRDTTLRMFDSPDINLDFVRQQCSLMKRDVGLDMVVVDYLQILEGGVGDTREQIVSNAARRLKVLSGELDCVVITGSQLNESESDQVYSMKSLRESRGIAHHSDLVVLLQHELSQMKEPTGNVDMAIVKQRRGRVGRVTHTWDAHKSKIT